MACQHTELHLYLTKFSGLNNLILNEYFTKKYKLDFHKLIKIKTYRGPVFSLPSPTEKCFKKICKRSMHIDCKSLYFDYYAHKFTLFIYILVVSLV